MKSRIQLFIALALIICMGLACKKKETCFDCWKNLGQVDEVYTNVCDKTSTIESLKQEGWDICEIDQ